MTMTQLLGWVTILPFATWFLTVNLCRMVQHHGRDPGILRTIRNELHPFRYGFATANFVVNTFAVGPDVGVSALFALNLGWCWWYRRENDDDDRWKRRKDAAAGYVREVAGRLTVVPEPA